MQAIKAWGGLGTRLGSSNTREISQMSTCNTRDSNATTQAATRGSLSVHARDDLGVRVCITLADLRKWWKLR